MPTDLATIADPPFILLAWGAGLGLTVAYVSFLRIVGPGFTWLTAGVATAIAFAASLSQDAWWGRAGLVLVAVGLVWARNQVFSGVALSLGGLALLVEASLLGGIIPAVSAALALGGVTGEMALGHWYLVDPKMPRWVLRTLAILSIVGLTFDSMVLAVGIGFPSAGGTLAFWVLVATSILLMVGVLGSLRYPAYSGVMAATGLSYLAVLTTLGAVFLGRAMVVGLGPFA